VTAVTTPLSDAEVQAARAATPGCDQVIHLNHAGSSLPTRAVLNTQLEHLKREAAIGGYEAAAERADDDAAVGASIAHLMPSGRCRCSRASGS